MKTFRTHDLAQESSDSNNFTGHARVTRMHGVCDEPAVNIYRVEFEPAARTNWHTHTGPQLLLVTAGRCLVQEWDGPIEEIDTGDVVCIEANAKHWHGAARDGSMTHMAINIDLKTSWLEKVEEYGV